LTVQQVYKQVGLQAVSVVCFILSFISDWNNVWKWNSIAEFVLLNQLLFVLCFFIWQLYCLCIFYYLQTFLLYVCRFKICVKIMLIKSKKTTLQKKRWIKFSHFQLHVATFY